MALHFLQFINRSPVPLGKGKRTTLSHQGGFPIRRSAGVEPTDHVTQHPDYDGEREPENHQRDDVILSIVRNQRQFVPSHYTFLTG